MAKLIVELKDETKALIQKEADRRDVTIKELTMMALSALMPELNGKD